MLTEAQAWGLTPLWADELSRGKPYILAALKRTLIPVSLFTSHEKAVECLTCGSAKNVPPQSAVSTCEEHNVWSVKDSKLLSTRSQAARHAASCRLFHHSKPNFYSFSWVVQKIPNIIQQSE